MKRLNPKLLLIIAIALSFGLSFIAQSRLMNAYYLDIILGIGINIILAVSLNLINGYTGQFSLGHAGFVAVGAHTPAALTTFHGPSFLPGFRGGQKNTRRSVLFFLAP